MTDDSVRNEFKPDYAVPPGETLEETLEVIGMSQRELAKRMGRPVKTVNEIIQGKAAITAETALQLEKVLDVPANFWLRLEQQYRETLARLDDQNHLSGHLGWLQQIPVKEMVKLGWIKHFADPFDQLREVLKFYGVASPVEWTKIWEVRDKEITYRRSVIKQSDPGALSAWLRKGEIEAQSIHCKPFDKTGFEKLLSELRSLTTQPPEVFQPELVRRSAEVGVAVAFVPDLPKTMVSGATRWLSPGKALVQLSLRGKTNDKLWFTFFHEAGHILLHGKDEVFLEGTNNGGGDRHKEAQANQFASDWLIPPRNLEEFLIKNKDNYTSEVIQEFARELNIAPAIVLGRLQHEKLVGWNFVHELKVTFTWVENEQENNDEVSDQL